MQRGKLRWRCRRGMRELDELLLRFVDREYDALQQPEQEAFDELLALQDPQLWNLLTGRETASDPVAARLISRISGSAGTED